MRVKELIKKLQNFDPNAFIYINYEPNYEDPFLVIEADTNNILLVPKNKYSELKDNQEFSFIED